MKTKFTKYSAGGLIAAAAVIGMTAVAFAADAPPPPKPNPGDVAWMLTSTLLVLMMSIPGLALFYGGLVRSKNMLSVLTQVFMIVSLVGILWALFGYSIALGGGGNAYLGDFSKAFLVGITPDSTVSTFTPGTVSA